MQILRVAMAAAISCGLVGAAAAQGNPAAGEELTATCQVCHGRDGIAVQPNAPNLAGQNEQYLVKALLDYREGRRQDEQMSLIAEALSDEDIADLAAWYASIEVSVTLPGE